MATSTFPAIEALGEIVDALKDMKALDLSLMCKVDLIRRSMVSPQLKTALQELLGDIRSGAIWTDGLDEWVSEREDVLKEWMEEGAAATRLKLELEAKSSKRKAESDTPDAERASDATKVDKAAEPETAVEPETAADAQTATEPAAGSSHNNV
jgi:hypothetical protein